MAASTPDPPADPTPHTRAECERRDRQDPLAGARERFELPDDLVYLDGNSLGALPRHTAGRVDATVREAWGRDLIASWNDHGWFEAPRRVGDKIGRLVGAAPGQVLVTDATTVNLFRLLAAAIHARPERPVLAVEAGNFPADRYIAQGLAAFAGGTLELREVDVDDLEALEAALDDRVAVLTASHVDYRSGALRDMAAVEALARRRGVWTCWDLAHSAGALPVELDRCGTALAVGCGYKYLNGGPGAPAFLYVRRDLQAQLEPPIWGWFGHAEPFAFEPDYQPAPDIRRFAGGTPPILSLVALEAGVDLMLELDLAALRGKAVALGELFREAVSDVSGARGLALASPVDPASRGNHLLYEHGEGYAVVQALIARGVVGDFRAPDGLRFGFAPAYLRYREVWDAAQALREVLETGSWRRPEFARRQQVT